MFAIIVSGRLPQTEFVQVDSSKFLITIPNADNINHIVVFMTGVTPFPDGMAGSVYFSWPDSNAPPTWQCLGFISNDKPSAIFKITQFKKDGGDVPMANGFGYEQSIVSHVAQIGISIEPIAMISQLNPVQQLNQDSVQQERSKLVEFATKAAENMFNYCASFAQSPQYLPQLTSEQYIPMSTIKQWYEKFIRRFQQDNSFMFS